MIIPFAGQALGETPSVSFSILGHVRIIVGEFVNLIMETVENPELALFAIMGVLVGLAGIGIRRPPNDFADMAKKKRVIILMIWPMLEHSQEEQW